MTRTRLLLLSIGPLLLVGGAYALSYPAVEREQQAQAARSAAVEARFARIRTEDARTLGEACEAAAKDVHSQLPGRFAIVVHAPFVIVGDVSEEDLNRLHRGTVAPVSEALWRSYFDRRPDRPVLIVALRDESSYREVARRLDGYEPLAYAGYTQRAERRIVFHLENSSGTLPHELAHVLALFDFPQMPEWFDEGLASLHEEAN